MSRSTSLSDTGRRAMLRCARVSMLFCTIGKQRGFPIGQELRYTQMMRALFPFSGQDMQETLGRHNYVCLGNRADGSVKLSV